jgi:hypothetical protein
MFLGNAFGFLRFSVPARPSANCIRLGHAAIIEETSKQMGDRSSRLGARRRRRRGSNMSTEFTVTLKNGSTLRIHADRCMASGNSVRLVNDLGYGSGGGRGYGSGRAQERVIAFFNTEEVISVLESENVKNGAGGRRY